MVDFTLREFSRVDVLVNVAGIQTVSPIEDFPEDKWDLMIALMLTAPFLLTKYAWPSMKAQRWGRVININSIHGLVASEFKAAYVSAKHGLAGLTKTAALEGGPYGITVNSICPAYVRTPLVDNQIADQAKSHGISRESSGTIMLQKAAVKRLIGQTIAEVRVSLLDAGIRTGHHDHRRRLDTADARSPTGPRQRARRGMMHAGNYWPRVLFLAYRGYSII